MLTYMRLRTHTIDYTGLLIYNALSRKCKQVAMQADKNMSMDGLRWKHVELGLCFCFRGMLRLVQFGMGY